MDNIRIEATDRTPEVDFAYNENAFSLRGEAYPEDVNAFFGPIVDNLEQHLTSLQDKEVTFNFELIYFNSSTAKILMMLFEMLDACASSGNRVVINWVFEADDDNMQELGEEYAEDLEHAAFNLQPQEV